MQTTYLRLDTSSNKEGFQLKIPKHENLHVPSFFSLMWTTKICNFNLSFGANNLDTVGHIYSIVSVFSCFFLQDRRNYLLKYYYHKCYNTLPLNM